VGVVLSLAFDAAHVRIDFDAMRIVLLSDTLHLVVRPLDVIAAVVTLTVVTAFAALLPSLRASRITPVTAMQSAE
jgi:ABC-type lipoprotein release transport system permease subunit